uniref:Translation elongation factor EF1B beta/delta subunit guanine nucleotide exchange domain-containing protein n=1 Tax=Pan paniscus TaxID=9597 RepID=A0A2R9C9P1_PANPA
MGFRDLKSPASLQVLNDYLVDKSYIKGILPGVKKAVGRYGPAKVEDTTGSGATNSKDDDEIDLLGSDEEESEEAKRLREEQTPWQKLERIIKPKRKKPALVAKSIQADGLVWGSSKLVPVGYRFKKLQIQCVVEDDKFGTDMLEEQIAPMDVAAFNKI